MKKFYFVLLLALCIVSANAQTWSREFTLASDTNTFKNGGSSGNPHDYTFSVDQPGYAVVKQLTHDDQFPFLQIWLSSLSITSVPYISILISSDVPQDLTISAPYVAGSASANFGKYTLTGANEFDTAFYTTTLTGPIKELQIRNTQYPCTFVYDYIRIGLAAHPIQATVNLSPKFLPASACTLKVSKVELMGASDPISKLICQATTPSAFVSDIAILESPDDTSFLITFNTKAITKSSEVAIMTVNLKDLSNKYSRSFSVALTITSNTIGIEEAVYSDLTIYPNPVQNMATVKMPNGGGILSVIDAAGRAILSMVIEKGISTVELNTSSLVPGTYSLVLKNDESLISRRFKK